MFRCAKLYLVATFLALVGNMSNAHAAATIQMLPPVDFANATCAGGSAGMLQWDGINPIHCVPSFYGLPNGNVGIGNVTPADKLVVQGRADISEDGQTQCCATDWTLALSEATSSTGRLPSIQFHVAGYQEAFLRLAKDVRVFEMGDNQGAGASLALLNGPVTRKVYLSPTGNSYFNGGNLGIGNTSPNTRLEVGDGGDGWANGLTIRSSYPTIYLRDTDSRGAMIHNNSDLLYFLSSCDTTGNPAGGNNWCTQANGYWPLYLNLDTNDAVFGGNVYGFGFFHNSDERLKKDIVTLANPIETIKQLRGVSYVWKASNKPALGVIAQEVEKVLPMAVSQDKDGTKSVEYDQIIAPLIEAVKAQQVEIESLKDEVAKLKGH